MDMDQKYKIEDFLEIRSAHGASFSPDGSKVAFLSNLTGVNQVYLVSCDSGEPEQLTSYEEPVSFAYFSPVKNEILFGMAKGGNEKTQFFLFDITSKTVRSVTSQPEAIHRFGSWSRDGKFITYSSNIRNGTDFDVYIMEIETGVSSSIFNEGGSCDSLGFSPAGTKVVVRKQHTFQHHDIYVVDLENKNAELLTPNEEKATFGAPRWLPDESGFFCVSNRSRDLDGLLFFDLKAKNNRYVLTPEREIEGTSITLDGKYLAVMVNEDGYRTMIIYDTRTIEPIANQQFPKGLISGPQWSSDGGYLVFTLLSATKNADVWVWSRNENRYWQITHSPRRIPEEIFVEPELINYKSFDGLQIPAFFFLPKGDLKSNKLPVIVDIHGGPEGQSRPTFDSLIQYFVYSGYAVITPNVRGSSGYGKKYLALDDIEKRMDSVTDLQYLHKFLKQDDRIDGGKIALMGGSYGGYMTLAGLTFHLELWAAGVDIVGMSNLVSFLENTSPWRRALREAEYGYLATDRKFLESISPLNFIEKIQAPLLIIHGANDPRVPLSEAEQMYNKLKESGKRAELLVYQDEGHGLSKLKNRLDAYPKIVDFLDSILKEN